MRVGSVCCCNYAVTSLLQKVGEMGFYGQQQHDFHDRICVTGPVTRRPPSQHHMILNNPGLLIRLSL